MTRFIAIALVVILLGFSVVSSKAGEQLSVREFRGLYDSLLSGKTLVTVSDDNGTMVKRERTYGKALDTGDGDFDIPVTQVITYTKDGGVDLKITIDILDRVHDLGGHAIVQEEVRELSVLEKGDEHPEEINQVEFSGIFRVGKNDKGGSNVHNFGLMPSVIVKGEEVVLTGSMVSYSCYPESGKSICTLAIRDYELGEYEPFKGYKIGKAIGDDYEETAKE